MHDDFDAELGSGGIFQLAEGTELRPGWALNVSPDMAGLRVDAFISARIPRLSRSRASRLQVLDLDTQKTLKKSATVTVNQRVLALRPVPDSDAEIDHQPSLIWEDDTWAVLLKPPTLATHPSASYFKRTVSYWLRVNGYPHMQAVHRLDVETSGILVCAKTCASVKLGTEAFAQQRVQKGYLALVDALPTEDQWTVDIPLGFDRLSRVPIKMGVGRLQARTHFQVLARGKQRSLVRAMPEGGRQHQIRIHARMSQCPLVGDKLYGPDESFFLNRNQPLSHSALRTLGHWRHCLHAYQISAKFLPKSFEIPPPKDWADVDGIPYLRALFPNDDRVI